MLPFFAFSFFFPAESKTTKHRRRIFPLPLPTHAGLPFPPQRLKNAITSNTTQELMLRLKFSIAHLHSLYQILIGSQDGHEQKTTHGASAVSPRTLLDLGTPTQSPLQTRDGCQPVFQERSRILWQRKRCQHRDRRLRTIKRRFQP